MIPVCYLSAAKEAHRFDRLFQELDILPSWFDVGDIKSLVLFISRERTIYQQNFIICDLKEASWSNEHIISAAQLLRRFSAAQFIFLAPDTEETTQLFGTLASFRVSGLIVSRTGSDIQAELRKCLTGDRGYTRSLAAMQTATAAAAGKKVSPLMLADGQTLHIRACGTMQRVGTTTQTFALYHFIKRLGLRPAILDKSGTSTEMLANLYQEQTLQNGLVTEINHLPFCRNATNDFNVYLEDLGVLSPEIITSFSTADISVLVAGTKPWELPPLARALADLRTVTPQRLVLLLSFATEQEKEAIKEYLGDHFALVPYHPDIWAAGDCGALRNAIYPCLTDACHAHNA